MKNIKIKGALFALLSLCMVSCDDYKEPDAMMTMFGIVDGAQGIEDGSNANQNPSYLVTNELAGLCITSVNDIYTEWVFSKRDDETGDFRPLEPNEIGFLRINSGITGYDNEDYTTDYTPYLDPNVVESTTCKQILFTGIKPGRYEFLARASYNEPVTYNWRQNWPYDGTQIIQYSSIEQPDGTHLIEHSYTIAMYMLFKGESQIFTDAACTQEVDMATIVDENGVWTISKGTTLYFREVSGDTEFDRVDKRMWLFEYTIIDAESVPDVEPTVTCLNDVSDKTLGVKFDEVGAFNVALYQERLNKTDEFNYNLDNFPTSIETNYLPVVIKVE